MKKRTGFCCLLLIILVACEKKSDAPVEKMITGKWKLTETLASPAGRGEWKAEDPANPRFVTFNTDGSLTDNDGLFPGIGRYAINTDSTKIVFYRPAIPDSFNMTYYIHAGLLTIVPPCIEPCGLHFTRAE